MIRLQKIIGVKMRMPGKFFTILILIFVLASSPVTANDEIAYYTDLTRDLCAEHGRIVHVYMRPSANGTLVVIEYKDGFLYMDNMMGDSPSSAVKNLPTANSDTNANNQQGQNNLHLRERVSNEIVSTHGDVEGWDLVEELRKKLPAKTIVMTRQGDHYHYLDCTTLARYCKQVTISEALAQKLTPCTKCQPPTS